ncbi:unnamed protein product [Caenorhabditis auriculariae]|uniref:NADH dehydrogenase [ubiquinone] iron-sulfur protein 4, mitochondrial n=1 Tax=Caenorhabditis auriculariae TaxID=2777116 RepID=A0A8S1GTB0_9PELO|nr:unnamed protein product [Caenorhabditis auriculariae]
MLRTSILRAIQAGKCVRMASSGGKDLPATRYHEAKRVEVDEILEKTPEKTPVKVSADETMDISGVPLEHIETRTARIFKPAKEATQTPWGNTLAWRIELDNRQRWENPLMGWSSTGDPLSNISMNMKFASKEDAVAFCEKNRWDYDIEEPNARQIKPKNYGQNYSWNKRSRIGTK